MSHYTTEVRFICEELAGLDESKGYNNVNDILNASAPRVFDFNFPIFDENYRLVLEKKILKHYYTREICAETVGLWKLWLDSRMNEIMPYYNKLYESELLEFNPFYDADYTRDIDRDKTGSEDNTNSRTNNVMGTHTGTVVDDGTNNLAQTGTIVADTEHTGTITDAVQERGTIVEDTEHTGTITDRLQQTGTVNEDTEHTGTITDRLQQTGTVSKDIDTTEDMDGTVTDEVESELKKTGTITTDDDTTVTRTDNLHATDARHDITNRWDYFNDTPQGGITGVADLEYLTNVRHITDDTTGSGGTLDNTGTQTNVTDGTVEETRNATDKTESTTERTYDTQKTIDGTETQTFNKTDTNTKTLNNEDDKTTTFNKTDTDTKTFANEDEKTTTFNKDTTDLKTMNNEDETTTTFNKHDNRDIDNTRTYNEATSESATNSELLNKQIASEEDYLEHVVGKFPGKSYAQLLKEFRETFLNIDMMIIEELADLFMLVY